MVMTENLGTWVSVSSMVELVDVSEVPVSLSTLLHFAESSPARFGLLPDLVLRFRRLVAFDQSPFVPQSPLVVVPIVL